jgi:hypothetical protein
MIKYIWYRWFQVTIRGARSFIKMDGDSKTYMMIGGGTGSSVSLIANKLLSDGYVEEFPIKEQ